MSQARLLASARDGGSTGIARAHAAAPQRWVVTRPSADGWATVTHQLLGDGAFGGETHRTTVVAAAGARLLVRGVAATPLRGPGSSRIATHLVVRPGAQLLYIPGALIPQRDADHTSLLRASIGAGGSLVAVSVVTPGRVGMGESGRFARLRLRTSVYLDDRALLFDDATVSGGQPAFHSPAIFGGAGAVLTIVAAGATPLAWPDAWGLLLDRPGILAAAAKLPGGGSLVRGLARGLGDVERLLAAVEETAREARTITGCLAPKESPPDTACVQPACITNCSSV